MGVFPLTQIAAKKKENSFGFDSDYNKLYYKQIENEFITQYHIPVTYSLQ